MDHQALLKKYMSRVLDVGGDTFVDAAHHSEVAFTDEEQAQLDAIEAGVRPKQTPVVMGGVTVLVDGIDVHALGVSSTAKWVTIDAEDLPTSGTHCVRVERAGRSGFEGAFTFSMRDKHTGEELPAPRAYVVGEVAWFMSDDD